MKTQKFTILGVLLIFFGTLFSMAQNSRIQIIHNSADIAAAVVDVYLNDALLLDDFAYKKATSFIDGPVGTAKIDIALSSSSSSAEAIYTISPTLEDGKTYVAVASGNVSTNGYTQSSNFMIHVFDQGREAASASGKTDVLVFHGSTDAPTVDIYESTAGELAGDAGYGDFAGYLELATSDYTLEVRDETGSAIVAKYSAPLSTLGLDDAAITVVASGFLSPETNSNGQIFGLYAITAAGGDFVQLPYTSDARVQVIHNSADAAAEMVDIYLNDEILIDDFEFRTASAFIDAPADAPVKLNVAPSTSTSSMDAIYTMPATLGMDETYVLIASGNVSATGYTQTSNFGIQVYDMGMEATAKQDTTAVLVFHGSTDAPVVDIFEATLPVELAGDVDYNDFAGYLSLPTSDYILEVRDERGENIVARYSAPLSALALDQAAITVIASGYLDPSANSDGPSFGLYVATNAGGDLLPLESPQTIFDVVFNSTAHDTLEAAIMAAGFNDELSAEGKYTVFAPTDDAFKALPEGILDALLADPEGNLAQVLLYHVAGDSVRSTSLSNGQMIATLQGQEVEIDMNGGVFINGAEVTLADIKTDNGIVHVIDAVLVPQTDVAIAEDDMFGKILTDIEGNTLYFFTKDVNDTSVCVDGCITNWPVFYTPGLFLPEGLNRHDFGSFERTDGEMQVTYKGWPLYYFVNDAQAGDINGDGINNIWYVAKPNYSIMLMDNQLVGNDDKNYTGDYTEGDEITQYFTDDYGNTLYTWINDVNNTNNFTNEDFSNNGAWPMYEEDSIVVPSTIDGTIFSSIDVYGKTQMTYNGWPLYYFGSDMEMRGSTKGVSVPSPGIWPVAVVDIANPLPATIVDIVIESEAHDTLEAAVIAAELADTLSSEGPFTVFAPTDAAFAALPAGTLDALLADPTGELAEILKYHVVSGKVMSGDLVDGMKVETLQGDSIMISIDGSTVMVNGATVTMADLEAGNGVVHVIDAVILPPLPETVVDIVVESEVHTTLEAAVIAAELADDLSTEGPFTVFAPTDAAFAALPAGTLDALLADPTGELAEILKYHVVSGKVMSGDLVDGMKVETLQGDSIMISIDGSTVMVNGATVTMANLEAGNGVVHVIDAVILPPLPETVVDIVVESEVHTTLEAAVIAAELADVLSTEGPFTVFAPTDAAFAALPAGTLDALLADPTGELAEILKYHVVSGKVMSGDLVDGMKVETLQGDSIMISIDGSTVMVNGATVAMANLEAGNGVVHVIDAVILPPLPETVVDIVVESEVHTTLEAAVIAAELADDLSTEGPFTVFAPTDAAFAALPAGTLDALLADPTGELAEILKYHVVSGKVMSGDLVDGMKVETLQGDSIMISIDGSTVMVNGATVAMADLEAQNGVVHVIDAVLTPDAPTNVSYQYLSEGSVNVYPNPARSFATLEYQVNERSNITLDIYNMLGAKIQSRLLGNLPQGTYRHQMNVSEFENGVYFLVLNAGSESIKKVLQVIK